MCILLGLGGEHHVNIDDFRWFCFDWIWLWWLYWIQLKFVNSVPYDGFSRPREVVKPRRKAKNLVFGHPWHPPNSTTFVFLSSGYRKLKVSLEVYKHVRGSKQKFANGATQTLHSAKFPQKKTASCRNHIWHIEMLVLTTLGLWKWFRWFTGWSNGLWTTTPRPWLETVGWVTGCFCLAWNGGCETSWRMSCSQHFDKFIVLKKKLSTYDRAPNEGHPIWPLLRSQAKSHRAHNSQAAWVEGFSSIHPSIHHPGSSTSFLGYDCLEWSISTIFPLNQQDTP